MTATIERLRRSADLAAARYDEAAARGADDETLDRLQEAMEQADECLRRATEA